MITLSVTETDLVVTLPVVGFSQPSLWQQFVDNHFFFLWRKKKGEKTHSYFGQARSSTWRMGLNAFAVVNSWTYAWRETPWRGVRVPTRGGRFPRANETLARARGRRAARRGEASEQPARVARRGRVCYVCSVRRARCARARHLVGFFPRHRSQLASV